MKWPSEKKLTLEKEIGSLERQIQDCSGAMQDITQSITKNLSLDHVAVVKGKHRLDELNRELIKLKRTLARKRETWRTEVK